MTHTISIWPLTAEEEFADTASCYESDLMSLDDAEQSYLVMTYENASELDEYKAQPAYLVSLDRMDMDGYGICQKARAVRPC